MLTGYFSYLVIKQVAGKVDISVTEGAFEEFTFLYCPKLTSTPVFKCSFSSDFQFYIFNAHHSFWQQFHHIAAGSSCDQHRQKSKHLQTSPSFHQVCITDNCLRVASSH